MVHSLPWSKAKGPVVFSFEMVMRFMYWRQNTLFFLTLTIEATELLELKRLNLQKKNQAEANTYSNVNRGKWGGTSPSCQFRGGDKMKAPQEICATVVAPGIACRDPPVPPRSAADEFLTIHCYHQGYWVEIRLTAVVGLWSCPPGLRNVGAGDKPF